MKLKKVVLICSIIALHVVANGQGLAIGKGASMITGLASFTSTGSGSGSVRTNVLTISPSMDYFILNHFFVGGGFSYSNQSMISSTITQLGIGPEIGYAFGNQDSKAFPYINAGWNYISTNFNPSNGASSANGSGVSVGLGMIIPIKSHIGFVVEGKYNTFSFSEFNESENIISLNIGIVGLLF